jgi:uncharacterized membrane protein YbhN (UPF0104 family)
MESGGLRVGRVIRVLVAVAVVAAIFLYFIPRVVDYGEVWAVILAMTWLELTTLLALAVWNQVTYVLVELSARPGLTPGQALTITQASTAMSNTLPAGVALGAGLQFTMYLSYGFSRRDVGVSLAVTGVWNTFAKLGLPIVALALLAIGGDAGGGLVAACVVGLLVLIAAVGSLALVLRSDDGAHRVGRRLQAGLVRVARLLHRPELADWGAILADFRHRTVRLLRLRWAQLTAATLISHLTLYVVLLLSLRHVGVSNEVVTWQEVFASFTFVRLLSALPITPGGVGVVELGLVASLIAAGGDEALLVAAVLVFRMLTFVLPIPGGVLSYILWRHGSGREVAPAA